MIRHFFSCLAFVLSVSCIAVASADVDGGFVIAKGKRFFAEVARTPAEHARGMMYRTSLKHDRCMFFLYERDNYHSIWMKNCYISLDIVWINAEGEVVEIVENAPPCSPMRGDDCPTYGGNRLSRHFIEFPAGTIRHIGLAVGDKIGWDLELSNGKTSKGGLPITDKSPAPARKSNASGTKTTSKPPVRPGMASSIQKK